MAETGVLDLMSSHRLISLVSKSVHMTHTLGYILSDMATSDLLSELAGSARATTKRIRLRQPDACQ